jgi:hypothetical protein
MGVFPQTVKRGGMHVDRRANAHKTGRVEMQFEDARTST